MVRALHPLMRMSRDLVNGYAVAMADADWGGHYEFTFPTSALAGGARSRTSAATVRSRRPTPATRNYVGKTPAAAAPDTTFGFRPVRPRYFHEAPEQFERPGLLYHPVKPGVRPWTRPPRTSRPRPAGS